MKKSVFKILFAGLVLFGLASCDQEDGEFDNKVLIDSRVNTTTILLRGDDTNNVSFQIKMPKQENVDIICEVVANPAKVDTYNEAYYDKAILLEAHYYTIQTPKVSIPVGSILSTDVEIAFHNLRELDTDLTYVLPITINGNIATLDSKNTMYYVFKGAALINVVADINENNVFVDWKNPEDFRAMEKFTAEALVHPYTFGDKISTLMGIEGKFLLRFSDTGLPPNQLQIATSEGNYTSSDLQIVTNKWTHIALTYDATSNLIEVYFDGKKVFSQTIKPIGAVDWGVPHSDESNGQPRCFWIGYSYDNNRYLDADISECRIWNKVLTADEIKSKNHFYYVDPASEGLIAYWKFNEGGGSTIKDYSINGNDATASRNLKWKSATLPAE